LETGQQAERVLRQFVSGNVFGTFGLTPALGRLIGPSDDTVGARPVAVVSYDYWTRRFHQDPRAVGTALRFGDRVFEIVGVSPKAFIGTEPGLVPDVFVPAASNTEALNSPGWSWFLIWVRARPGITPDHVRQILQADFDRDHQARLKGFSSDTPRTTIEAFLSETISLRPAAHGASPIQKHLASPLLILMALVGLVLVMACATVGNLLTGQTLSRAKEMALRVSIGAGRARLMQLVLVESAMLALGASALGALVAWWAAPAVLAMIEPIEIPGAAGPRLRLAPGVVRRRARRAGDGPFRVRAGAAGLLGHSRDGAQGRRCPAVPAGDQVAAGRPDDLLRVRVVRGGPLQGDVRPALVAVVRPFVRSRARAGGECARRRRAHGTLAAAGRRRETAARRRFVRGRRLAAAFAERLAEDGPRRRSRSRRAARVHARRVARLLPDAPHRPGSRDATSDPATPDRASTTRISRSPASASSMSRLRSGTLADGTRLASACWCGRKRMSMRRSTSSASSPTRRTGRSASACGRSCSCRTAGLGKARCWSAWPESRRPSGRRSRGRFVASGLARGCGKCGRRETSIDTQMVVERLLARLTGSFATLALLLAGIGLYGVVNDAVIQRRREIGLRMALGAQATDIVRHVTIGSLVLVSVGLLAGLGAGVAFGRLVGALLFQVTPTDPAALAPRSRSWRPSSRWPRCRRRFERSGLIRLRH
jgi:hypothetical protein